MFRNIRATVISLVVGCCTLVPLQAAHAADPCLPSSVGVTAFAVHPGQKVGLQVNGSPLTSDCSSTDLGLVVLTYGPRTSSTYSSGSVNSSLTSWKWKNFTYEDLIAFMKEAKITDAIDAQSVLGLSFYRKDSSGQVDVSSSNSLTIGVVLDPTTAGPCHPDSVSIGTDTDGVLNSGSTYPMILNGTSSPNVCTEKDSGWLFVGYAPDGTNFANTFLAYQPDWAWGGKIGYDWFKSTLAYATPALTSDMHTGGLIEVRFWRGGNTQTQPNIDAYTFYFTSKIGSVTPPPTPTPTNKPAPRKTITITCIKGKSIKKVSGVNPKCPSGYKKK
jgi:hypothetical protein